MAREMDRRCALAEQIAAEERRLAELDANARTATARLADLRRELEVCEPAPRSDVVANVGQVPTTPAEKIALFRNLFRGRTDVFPRRWENAKTGRKGYAPACSNEWVRGVCEKPRVKCGECPNQAFTAVGDREVLDHLQGRHVMGVYALLEDETCRFLAADFDKESWREDVAAYSETCRAFDVPVAIERSRSGDGAHAWFFFADTVAARTARRMGCYLLTETMSRRHELSMASYDRLFPNQDTMPAGGFGNLIALALQHEPRKLATPSSLTNGSSPSPASPRPVDGTARDVSRHQGRRSWTDRGRQAEAQRPLGRSDDPKPGSAW